MKRLLASIALAAIAAAAALWYRNRQSLEAMRQHQAAYEARTAYTANLFRATVTFPRGGATTVDFWGDLHWKGKPFEAATCSGPVEEHLYAEFHATPAAFADAQHPLLRIHLGILYGKLSVPGDEAFFVIREDPADGDGWRLRYTMVASPHGALVHPPEIGAAVVASWPVAPGYVHEPFEMPGPEILPPTPQMNNYQRQRIQRKKEYKAGQEKLVNDERRKKHHHFAIVEAVRNLDGGRSVAIRKVGQYFSSEAFEKQADEVKMMLRGVKAGP